MSGDSGDKTEPPTPKRLREAREQGDVAKSQDVAAAMTMFGASLFFIGMWQDVFSNLLNLIELPTKLIHLPFEEAFPVTVSGIVSIAFDILIPVIATLMFLAVAADLMQIGVLFSVKSVMPKLDNLNPKKWFSKVFSIKNLGEFVKNILKVSVLTATVWIILSNYIKELFAIASGTIWSLWYILGSVLRDLTLSVSMVFSVIACIDFMFQKWQYNKRQMMSKQEIKQEYKDMEGDPLIKGKRKQLHQEMAMQNPANKVRKAKVVVVNPIHYAIAIDYERGRTLLPVILAKGEGILAQRMVAIAQEEGIPVMQNIPLAHSLFMDGIEDAYIPRNLIAPVAEVLRWVNSLNKDILRKPTSTDRYQ